MIKGNIDKILFFKTECKKSLKADLPRDFFLY